MRKGAILGGKLVPLKELPYSRWWALRLIKRCEILAFKINGKWYVPVSEAEKLRKRKKRRTKA